MKLNYLASFIRPQTESLATFGNTQLLRKHEDRHELHGGTTDDRTAAREWISLVLTEAVISLVPTRRL